MLNYIRDLFSSARNDSLGERSNNVRKRQTEKEWERKKVNIEKQ